MITKVMVEDEVDYIEEVIKEDEDKVNVVNASTISIPIINISNVPT